MCALSPVYTGSTTRSGFESGLRPRSAGGLSYPDRDLDRLHLHGAESGIGSSKVVPCKRGFSLKDPPPSPLQDLLVFLWVVAGDEALSAEREPFLFSRGLGQALLPLPEVFLPVLSITLSVLPRSFSSAISSARSSTSFCWSLRSASKYVLLDSYNTHTAQLCSSQY